MQEKTLILSNTSIISDYGTYQFQPITLTEARKLLSEFLQAGRAVLSAIGHQSTADQLSVLLGYPVAVNRFEFKQTLEDIVLVVKLKQRAAEGKGLSHEEIEDLGYAFGLLTRLS